MRFQYSFRHMRSSEALQNTFERKFAGGLEALVQASSPVHVTFMVENDLFKMHVELHGRDHKLVEVKEASEDMQKTIDLVIEKLFGILTRSKDRQVDHRPNGKTVAAAASTPAEGMDAVFVDDEGYLAEA